MQSDTNEFSFEEEDEYSKTKQKIKETFDKYLDSLTNEKQLLLIQQLLNCCPDPRDQIQEVGKQYLEQFEQRVKPKNQYQNFEEDLQNSLLMEHFQTKKDVGASVIMNDGRFILTDKQTTKLLEWKFSSTIQKTLQGFCAVACQTNLFKHIKNKDQLLGSNQNENKFKMTIYSETTRKKGMKYLKIIYDNISKAKTIKNSIIEKLQEIQDLDTYHIICIKFLRTVSIKLKKEKVSKSTLLDFKMKYPETLSSPILKDMAKNPADKVDVLLCEIKGNAAVEKIDQNDFENDLKLKDQEKKWQAKISQLKQIRQMPGQDQMAAERMN